MRSVLTALTKSCASEIRSSDRRVGGLATATCCLLLAGMFTATGCSKAPAKKATPAAGGAAAEGDSDEPLGVDYDTEIAVDGGKIGVCSPTGWTRASQSKDYLVKYVPGRKKTFPSIVVTAADAPEGMAEVDGDSQREFVAAIAASLAETYTKAGKSTLVKKPTAVKLGSHFGVTWAAPATIKVDGIRESIDRSSYALVIDGRMYTVEVRAPKDKLDAAGRAAAQAVAAALAPPATEETAAEEPPEPAAEAAEALPAAAE